MRQIIILLFVLIPLNGTAQNQNSPPPPPPSAAMPTEENSQLIEKLISVSAYESYFNNYCKNRITREAKDRGWSEEEISSRVSKINFDNFKHSIHNYFANFTKEELKEIIDLTTKINKKSKSSIYFLTSDGIQNNLDLKVREYIK